MKDHARRGGWPPRRAAPDRAGQAAEQPSELRAAPRPARDRASRFPALGTLSRSTLRRIVARVMG